MQHSTEHALAEVDDDITALDDRTQHDTLSGAAIVHIDDQVLRYVDQATRQVARVRGFQRGIGETLTSTVRRDKVLQYVQTLAKVCGDRIFDDRSVRLGHQATHTGELANLRRRTPRARVSHDKDRIE